MSWYLNFDYGRDRSIGLNPASAPGPASPARRIMPSAKKYAVSGRLEYFDDRNGFTTGTAQTLKEFTLTAEYKLTGLADERAPSSAMTGRIRPFFEKNSHPNGAKSQPTALLG